MALSELAKQYADILSQVNSRKGDLKSLEEQKDQLEEKLVDAMLEEGIPQLRTESGVTLYRRTDTFWGAADGVSKEELVKVLANNAKTSDLVSASFNANSLRSRMNEIAQDDQLSDDDQELFRVLRKFEKQRIGYRS